MGKYCRGCQFHGYLNSLFQYQLNNLYGAPLTESGYLVAEYMSGDSGVNTNGQYLPAPNGLVTDNVGFNRLPSVSHDYLSTQTFSVLYGAYFYDLSSVFQRENFYNSNTGVISNTVTVIVP